eukprot:gene57500-biopygen100428
MVFSSVHIIYGPPDRLKLQKWQRAEVLTLLPDNGNGACLPALIAAIFGIPNCVTAEEDGCGIYVTELPPGYEPLEFNTLLAQYGTLQQEVRIIDKQRESDVSGQSSEFKPGDDVTITKAFKSNKVEGNKVRSKKVKRDKKNVSCVSLQRGMEGTVRRVHKNGDADVDFGGGARLTRVPKHDLAHLRIIVRSPCAAIARFETQEQAAAAVQGIDDAPLPGYGKGSEGV